MDGLNVLTFRQGDQTYRFVFDDANRQAAFRQIAQFAANPELSLTWFDAATLSRLIRGDVKTQGAA